MGQLTVEINHRRAISDNKLGLFGFDLDSYRYKNYLTHNFHPYPAKFIPQIPRIIIEKLSSKGDTILDPFCGSGTTLVEANLLGRNAIGIDLNPIATLVSRVKTRRLTLSQLVAVRIFEEKIETLAIAIERGRDLQGIRLPADVVIPDFLNRDHWFQNNIQKELAVLRHEILSLEDVATRELCLVAFSSIIVKVSNQDSETRWTAVSKNLADGAVFSAFCARLVEMLERSAAYSEATLGTTKVIEQSVEKGFPVKDQSVDLVVTSPPYMNSFDYYLYHKLRFYWLGFNHYLVQTAEIGSRNKHSDQSKGVDTYIESMSQAFKELFRVLKGRGHAAIIIGDSIYQGKVIDMLDVYRTLGRKHGFIIIDSWSYDQRKYTTSFTPRLKTAHKKTHVISFQRP